MPSVPVIAIVIKLSTILSQVQRKIGRGLTRPLGVGEGGLGEISPSLGVLLFRPIFQRFEKITYDLY
jgi:hypothetical protein